MKACTVKTFMPFQRGRDIQLYKVLIEEFK